MSTGDHQSSNTPTRDSPGLDVENSFFRSWALRTHNSEYSSASDVSPGTRSPVTTPISPNTGARPRRREGRPSSESRFGDGYVQHEEGSSSRRITVLNHATSPRTPSALTPRTPSALTPRERRMTSTRASIDSVASRAGSNASTIVKRTLKLVKGPALARTSTLTPDESPTKRRKNGLAWKREISGHWLEIRIGKKDTTGVASPDMESMERPNVPYPTSKVIAHPGSHSDRVTVAPKSQHSLDHPAHRSNNSSSPEPKPKMTIVDRTKRLLGITSSTSLTLSPTTQARTQSDTGKTLHEASFVLQNLVAQIPTGSASTSDASKSSATSIAGHSKRRPRFLVRPGYRSQKTGHSSSSSLRRVMFGVPPVNSPDEDGMYTGSDSQQYFRVDLTLPNAPTYLPSEARRIHTPPLPSQNSKLRGFFFDYNAPRSAEQHPGKPWPNAPMNTAPLLHPQRDLRRTPTPPPKSPGARLQRDDDVDGNWFRHKVALGEAEDERRTFELNMPEHLPSSPLCPRHPKHKSGGKGVCVYHGRNKTGPDDVVEEIEALWR